VLGIPFTKGFFILFVAAVIGALAIVLSIAFARVKIASSLVKEKTLIADSTVLEFDDFKKKAMEKQTKLSRELQNERNKWQEYRKL
jgi:Skp family chaperone for outer membrane proteins